MDILKMLADLRQERQQIEEAILVIERLATATRGKRLGRPPKWMSAAKAGTAPAEGPKTTRVISADVRKRMAEGQKKRWAAIRAAKA
jgi:hypothetical protein